MSNYDIYEHPHEPVYGGGLETPVAHAQVPEELWEKGVICGGHHE